jgi:acetyl-CoA C-acetyltransferase
MIRFGTTENQMAMVAVKNHRNAMNNPFAHFHREVTVEQVLSSKVIAHPIKLLDCSPISDGGAAVILARDSIAKRMVDTPVWVVGSGSATDSIALHDRDDLTILRSTVIASHEAYQMAGIGPEDVDVAEVHDCFTIAELMAYEDLGLCEKGGGGKLIQDGETEIGGRIPVNPSGGLKAKGHPVGASGVGQVAEIALQLRGEAAARQVKEAGVGLTHSVGGTGSSCYVHIFKR